MNNKLSFKKFVEKEKENIKLISYDIIANPSFNNSYIDIKNSYSVSISSHYNITYIKY